jgi:PD-(D/E)XK nuclease superfamily
VTPGELPTLDIAPQLDRISPSRFVALNGCTLRELWATSSQSPLLPASPRARLGTIVHRLLELASNGLLVSCEDSIEKAWSGIVVDVESKMSSSWIEQSLVPLSRTVNDFEVQRLRAWNRAMQLMRPPSPVEEVTVQQTGFGCEIWVQSTDGTVGGYIDAVYQGESGRVIRDFKTGSILEESGNDGAIIHLDYLVQIKLYAALYQETFGLWPTHVELVPVQGESLTIAVDRSECEELLLAAKRKRLEVNNRIKTALLKGRDGIKSLASPSVSNCRFCLWRPGCVAYYERSETAGDSEWPADIRGTVAAIQPLGNGRLLLIVRGNDAAEKKVRQLDPSPDRHPAQASLGVGEGIGIYNTRRNPNTTDVSETSSTTIYRTTV